METSLASIRPLYGFLDPHGGGTDVRSGRLKELLSSSAIAVGGQDDHGRYFILDVWKGRVSVDELMDRMYATCSLWNLKALGGEANGLAGLFHDAVLRDAKQRNISLPLIKVIQPTVKDKINRIRDILQPLIGHGRLIVRRGLEDLMTQLTAFPRSLQMDAVDAVASLVRFMPPRPRRRDVDAEHAAKLKYLRDRGVDPRIIASVAEGRENTPWNRPRGTPFFPPSSRASASPWWGSSPPGSSR